MTAAVETVSISKSFDSGRLVIDDVSFPVQPGEVLEVVGPNGSGKTIAIRMVFNVIRPDSGRVLLFGEPFADNHHPMLGYLPEERGLYRDQKVLPTFEYLGALKGLTKQAARESGGHAGTPGGGTARRGQDLGSEQGHEPAHPSGLHPAARAPTGGPQ